MITMTMQDFILLIGSAFYLSIPYNKKSVFSTSSFIVKMG